MTTTTISSRSSRRSITKAFTLVELLIATALSAVVLAAVFTSFVYMTKSGINLYNYVYMEEQARRALEQFGEDVRQAYQATWTNAQDVTLYMSGTSANAATDIRYYYDSANQTFNRTGPDRVTGVVSTRQLIQNVQNDFTFTRWYRGVPPTSSSTDAKTWQLQLSLTIKRQSNEYGITTTSAAAATNLVVSARFILRNKS